MRPSKVSKSAAVSVHYLLKNGGEYVNVDWLGYDFIDFVGPGALDIAFFYMSRDCDNCRLRNFVYPIKPTDVISLLEAIHNWHADVSQHQAIDVATII